jgi:hypothetical protein
MRLFITVWLGILLLTAVGCRPRSTPAESYSYNGHLEIEAPDRVSVGSEVTITVRASRSVPDGTPAQLLTMNGVGQKMFYAPFNAQIAVFELSGDQIQQAGKTTLLVTSGKARSTAVISILPGTAASPLFLLAGPRSLVADGVGRIMTAVVANDQYGNILTRGHLTIRALYPDQTLFSYPLNFQHGVAWTWLDSTLSAGTVRIAAVLDEASSPENSLLAIASSPQPFSLSADPPSSDADGWQLVHVRSSLIQDENHNTVPNGLSVTFIVESINGAIRRIPVQTIDGVAEAVLQAPTMADTFTIYAMLGNTTSKPVTIHFGSTTPANPIPLEVVLDQENRSIQLSFGPVTGALGQLMPDGTPVRFSVTDPSGNRQWIESILEQGVATVDLRMISLRTGSYTVEAYSGAVKAAHTFYVP